jgi:hypothetical protein
MAITHLSNNHEQPLPADELAPLRLPRRGPRRARAPGRDRDPSRRPEPVPMWIAGAASQATAAMEAEFRRMP